VEAGDAYLAHAIRLRSDAAITAGPGGGQAISLGAGSVRLPDLPRGISAALAALASRDITEVDAQQEVTSADGINGALRWQALLSQMDTMSLLERAVLTEAGPIARLRPAVKGRSPGTAARAPDVARLSRFAAVRAAGGKLIAERPGGHALVELYPPAAGLLGALADWAPVRHGVPGLPPRAAQAVANLLAGAGLLAPGGPGDDAECADAALAQWSPADLWLHATSRGTRSDAGYGGSYPLAGRFPPLPAVPARRSGQRIELPHPDLEVTAKADPSFTQVLEDRRSVRSHDAASPITLAQLGELLYRSARVRRVFEGEGQELADRPYPCGGAVHELEIYPLITDCAGAPAGLWHYAAADHALEHVADPGPAAAALVAGARAASLMQADPQVTLIISARFGRVMWKYQAIAYSLVLKHVGVLYQTIYLVATAMGLAVCGLGGGDAADFAAASCLPYFEEGSVGELVVGSRPPDRA
jgi:SagB-type dehydrogenase family enzyme